MIGGEERVMELHIFISRGFIWLFAKYGTSFQLVSTEMTSHTFYDKALQDI